MDHGENFDKLCSYNCQCNTFLGANAIASNAPVKVTNVISTAYSYEDWDRGSKICHGQYAWRPNLGDPNWQIVVKFTPFTMTSDGALTYPESVEVAIGVNEDIERSSSAKEVLDVLKKSLGFSEVKTAVMSPQSFCEFLWDRTLLPVPEENIGFLTSPFSWLKQARVKYFEFPDLAEQGIKNKWSWDHLKKYAADKQIALSESLQNSYDKLYLKKYCGSPVSAMAKAASRNIAEKSENPVFPLHPNPSEHEYAK